MAEIITKDRKEYNIWDKVNNVWNRLNFLTNAKSVDFDDGKTAQNKVGAIDGITSDLSGESETVAASIKCVNQLNNSLGGLNFYEDESGNKYVVGADAVPKKLGECDFKITISAAYDTNSSNGLYNKEFTYKNGNWTSSDIYKDNGSGIAIGWSNISIISFELL